MRCLAVIALLVVLSYAAYVDVGNQLLNRVIHVESLRFRGYWMAGRFDFDVMFTGCGEKDIYYKDWSQFKVIQCGKFVCLQSLRYPDMYLAAYYNLDVKIEKSFYPNDQIWAQWRIECTSATSMSDCRFFSPRFNNYLKADYTYYAKTYTDMGIWLQMRILAPKPSDYYVTILSTENESNVEQKKTIKMREGVSDTTSTSSTITTTISMEVQMGFSAFSASASASISSSWQTASSKTYESSTEISYELVIPARTKITFQQLTGSYGPFSVAAKEFKIKSDPLAAGDALSYDKVQFYEIGRNAENHNDQNKDEEVKSVLHDYHRDENVDAETRSILHDYHGDENKDAEAKSFLHDYNRDENMDAEARSILHDYHRDKNEEAETKSTLPNNLRGLRYKRV